jgi:hypothetical protein
MLVHSPTYLFIIPGLILSTLGAVIAGVSMTHIAVFGRQWELHTMIAGALLTIVGVQVIGLGLCAHTYGTYFMGEKERWFDRMRARYRLEHGLVLGGIIIGLGLFAVATIVGQWIAAGTGQLSEERLAVLAATLIIIGVQIFFTSFLLSILGLRRVSKR